MKEFKYKIVERIAVLSETEGKSATFTKELNLISFNGGKPKYDIRQWEHKDNEEPKMYKGITLDEEEFEALKKAILR